MGFASSAQPTCLQAHVDYIHYNPVKHGHARLPVEWPHSSIHQFIERGWMAADWCAVDTILLAG